MNYVRSILAVLSAPVVFGVFCVPLVGVLMSMNVDLQNDMGGTYDVALTLQVEALQIIILLIIGFIVAAIAPSKPMVHATVAVVLMLGIGVSVQLSFWESMLVWHHFVFFASIVGGLYLGAWCRIRFLPRQSTL